MPLGIDQKSALCLEPAALGRLTVKIRRGQISPGTKSRLHKTADFPARQSPDEYVYKVVDVPRRHRQKTCKKRPAKSP